MLPQVRDLNDLIKNYSASYDPLRAIDDQQLAANDASGQAQEAGLDAKKRSAFKQIGQTSQDKGMFFSGFAPTEEAEYVGSTYLPAVANLQSEIAKARASILGRKAGYDVEARQGALGAYENDRSAYSKAAGDQADREFQAEQARITREATAGENAKDRAAAAAKGKTTDVASVVSSVGNFLKTKVGKDGKVSPKTFQEGRQQWIAAGGSPDAYAQAFYGYINTGHSDDYF